MLVQPKASRARLCGEHDGRLKVQVTAPPVDGEANAALLELLASALGVRRAQLQVVEGHTGRRKRVRVEGLTADAIEAALARSCR